MRTSWIARGLAAMLLVWPAAGAVGRDPQLSKALDLFDQQEYAAAQQVLSQIDRSRLSKEDQAEYDRLAKELPAAIAAAEQAAQDLAAGDEALEAGRWDEAEARYAAVLQNRYAPAKARDKAAGQRKQLQEKKKLAEAAAPTGVLTPPAPPPMQKEPATAPAQPPEAGPGRLTPIDEMRLRDELLWQRAVAQSEELAAKAREAVDKEDFALARQLAEAALAKIEAARNYAEPVAKYLAAREAAERLKAEVQDAYEAWQRRRAEIERQEIAERVAKRRELAEQHRREKVEQLLNTASQLRKEQKFEEAAEVLRQVLYIDPSNAQARYQLEVAEDYASLHMQRSRKDDFNRQMRDAIVSAHEALIPWDYEVLYPKNWLELTARRAQAGVGVGSEQESELHRRLDEIVPEFQFREVPFQDVLEHLQQTRNLNLSVDWDDLAAAGIEPDRPVNVSLRNLPLRTVLKEVLAQVGGDTPLSFALNDGVLRIGTRAKLSRSKFVRVYDIRDLLISTARFTNAAKLDPMQVLDRASGRPIGGSGRLFASPGEMYSDASAAGREQELVNQILEVVRQTVEPDSWQEAGGDATIRELNGQLIVYNTSEAHTQVRGLLDQLRARRALQIALECRFLDVTSNFLEEFGVDLDFVFNTASAGYDRAFTGQNPLIDPFSGAPVLIPRQFSRTGVLPNSPAYGTPMTPVTINQPYGQPGLVPYTTGVSPHFNEMTPITAQQSSLALTNPGQYQTHVPGSFGERATLNPALNIAGTFLDNLQVDFLIRATQANARSAIVQAPRIVMENWSQTFIQVGRSSGYVASITPAVAEGAALAQPVPAQAQSGTTLGVFGTISADRRYVTVRVEATQSDAPRFERFEVTRASGNSPGSFVQLLDQGFVMVNTQVTIPDGGTVLLGGLKQAGEVEVEAGVPILSKVPVVKRFFSNRTTIKDTRTLLILLKAKIIIQTEAEEEAFPTFTPGAVGG